MVWACLEERKPPCWEEAYGNGPIKENKIGKTKKRCVSIMKDVLKVVGLMEDNAVDKERWREIICSCDL